MEKLSGCDSFVVPKGYLQRGFCGDGVDVYLNGRGGHMNTNVIK